MPVNIVLLSAGTLAFVKVAELSTLFDQPSIQGDINAVFYKDDFSIDNEPYSYNTVYEYKNIPSMLKWLQQQQLLMPQVNQFFM